MGKYGFVYLWYDRKHNRFYVGCRWENETDSYICSSSWMRNSYNRRPQDFKRRILARIYTNRTDLLAEEFRWLSMIKDHELGKRYYNLSKHHFGHWSANKKFLKTVGQKISKANKGRKVWSTGAIFTEKHKQNLSKAHLGKKSPRKGKTHTKKSRQKMSMSKMGKTPWNVGINHSEKTKTKISQKLKGKKFSDATKKKMAKAQKKRRQLEKAATH